ncbi:unnamed protein product, partial [Brenthis ino]
MTSNLTHILRFRPLKRGEDREKLKERLANTMTYGDVEQKPPSPPRLIKQKPKLPTKKEQWNDLHSNGSHMSRNKKSTRPVRKSRPTEENVAAYEKLSPLQYSPRRRV